MKIETKDGSLTWKPGSDMIASNIESLRDFIAPEIENKEDFGLFVLDAGGVEKVDSLGVNLIIGLYKQMNSESKTFCVVNASTQFLKVAKFFRFTSLFDVSDSEKGT